MSLRGKLLPIPRVDVDITSLNDSTYVDLNPNGFDKPIVLWVLDNDSDRGIDLSQDGSTPHDYIRSNGLRVLDGGPQGESERAGEFPQRTVWKGKLSASGGSGTLRIIGYYLAP